MATEPILIAGKWRTADATGVFSSENPSTCEQLRKEYPVSSWADCEAALDAASAAFKALRSMPAARIADFLERYAELIEERRDSLVEMAHEETGLPKSPRLADVELPRTTGQLRQAAAAARTGNWRQPIIDSANNIRSCHGSIGPVIVFGPNNFPFAFGSISGGDFAAAIAAGNPVIAKANSSHPGTTKLFAEAAQTAGEETGMPSGMVQLLYRTSHPVGEQLVTDSRMGATGYTGARSAGLKLKKAADDAGKPIYLELSSVNPVVLLPSILEEKSTALAEEFTSSCLMGAGQFCTNPGMIIVIESAVAGGSMITARFAGEQGRQVMAVPGRIDQSSSGGCHQLIRDGATMVTSVDDILEELRYTRSTQTEVELPMDSEASQFEFNELERKVLDCFKGGELCLPDQISQQLNRSSAQVSATLMGLELKRLVAKRADGYFEAH